MSTKTRCKHIDMSKPIVIESILLHRRKTQQNNIVHLAEGKI